MMQTNTKSKSKSLSTATEVPLGGLERLFTISENGNHIIAHSMALDSLSPSAVDDIPRAFHRVVQRHPRMRSLQNDPPLTIRIQPDVTLSEIRDLVTVYNDIDNWQSHIEQWFNVVRDRSKELPCFLHVLLPVHGGSDRYTRLILYSDHIASDGLSGLIVLNDLLCELANPANTPVQPYHILPSVTARFRSTFSNFQRVLERILFVIVRPIAVYVVSHEKPTLALDPTSVDFDPRNLTCQGQYAMFGTGTEKGLSAALSACRSRSLTLMGPIIACAALAAAHSSFQLTNRHFSMSLEVDYDFRRRFPEKSYPNPVGMNSLIAALSFIKSGVDLPKTKFWAFAKKAKKHADGALRSFLDQRINMLYIHKHLNCVEMQKGKGPVFPKAFTADLSISNLTGYTFPETHLIAEQEVAIKHLHFVNSFPFIGNSAILFLVGVAGKIHYGIAHRLEKETAKKFFDSFMRLVEAIGTARDDETLSQFAARILEDV
ncbi:hypothetical protein BJ742DRAFT_846111 [Cladochytrium replicatum]|nr:hypothetical protein BJ742DRAFT_846111 [Cladochytrium replicatum]